MVVMTSPLCAQDSWGKHYLRLDKWISGTGNLTRKRQIEPSREKTYSMASALCIDPDQPALSAQTDPGRHNPSQGDRGIE